MNASTITDKKALKLTYANMAWGEGTKMAKWAVSDIFEVVELSNGNLYAVSKHYMNTEFCFGHDTDMDSYETARNNELAAHTYKAFLEANTQDAVRTINKVKKAIEQGNTPTTEGYNAFYIGNAYSSKSEKLVAVVYHHAGLGAERLSNYTLASVDDLKLVLAALERQLANTTKRCSTYWLKYQDTKLHTWTYYRD